MERAGATLLSSGPPADGRCRGSPRIEQSALAVAGEATASANRGLEPRARIGPHWYQSTRILRDNVHAFLLKANIENVCDHLVLRLNKPLGRGRLHGPCGVRCASRPRK
eukprot:scaffold66270_cov31-Tisochrysis_lutea.AAC.4